MKDLTWIKERMIAHRGLHSLDKTVPENSMKAFELAVEKNYGIEMDINVLKDGTVVVFHDHHLKRLVPGRTELLSDLNFEDIKDLKIWDSNEKISTLKEVLEYIDGRVPLLIELKPLGNKSFLCENFWETIKDYKGDYGIHSFSPSIVKWFKDNHPEVIRGQITEYFTSNKDMKKISKYLMKSMFFNKFTKPDFVNYGIVDLPNKYCDKAYKKGLCIIAYASKNQEEFDLAKEHYDNSVFEYFIPR
ncbi:MAG: glycerophosphodiester phosphodiesterase [Tenericutes bacterium]|nr:glycerophosphodiester phosphodiesterase [Mycoplasmatota bacterium]